ncbi:hypothetical protein A2U01_0103078, partial [Trifolium medium]|nr:hypothetical protein [Trifolium medium]
MEVQTNTQTTLNESAKGVEHNEEESMPGGCGVVKIIDENQAPRQEESCEPKKEMENKAEIDRVID